MTKTEIVPEDRGKHFRVKTCQSGGWLNDYYFYLDSDGQLHVQGRFHLFVVPIPEGSLPISIHERLPCLSAADGRAYFYAWEQPLSIAEINPDDFRRFPDCRL